MGVAFALGFVAVLMLLAGIGCVLVGIIILVIRGFLKRKTHKKYRIAQVMGIIPLTIGVIILIPLIIIACCIGIPMIYNITINEAKDAYYGKYVETGICIEVDEDGISVDATGNLRYREKEFIFEGKIYQLVEGVSVQLNDSYRDKAVANMDNGVNKLTVFEYNHSACEGMLCVNDYIFATEEQMEKLINYYNDTSEFTYQYQYTKNASMPVEDLEMDDKVYLGLINYDTQYIKVYDAMPEGSSIAVDYDIIQFSKDKRLERIIEVQIRKNGDITVRAISNPLGKKKIDYSSTSAYYVITDAEVKRQLSLIADEVQGGE